MSSTWTVRADSPGSRRGGSGIGREPSFHRALTEQAEAPGLYAEIMALSPRERRRVAARERRFSTLGLVAHLLAQSRSPEDPALLAEHARLAFELIERLPSRRYPAALVWDFGGQACMVLARARRLAGDLPRAAAALAVAEAALGLGTGDALDEARLLEELAALRRQQGRLLEAHRLRRQARDLYLEVGDERAAAVLEVGGEPRGRGGRRRQVSKPTGGSAAR